MSVETMDNLYVRQTLCLGYEKYFPVIKNILKLVKWQGLTVKCCNMRKTWTCKARKLICFFSETNPNPYPNPNPPPSPNPHLKQKITGKYKNYRLKSFKFYSLSNKVCVCERLSILNIGEQKPSSTQNFASSDLNVLA